MILNNNIEHQVIEQFATTAVPLQGINNFPNFSLNRGLKFDRQWYGMRFVASVLRSVSISPKLENEFKSGECGSKLCPSSKRSGL